MKKQVKLILSISAALLVIAIITVLTTGLIHMKEKGEAQIPASDDLKESIGVEADAQLGKLGFTDEQIDDLFDSVKNKADEELLRYLCMAESWEDYDQVFSVKAEYLSEEMKRGLYRYSWYLWDRLFDCDDEGTVLHNDFTAMEAFFDAVLYHEEYCTFLMQYADEDVRRTAAELEKYAFEEEKLPPLIIKMNKQTVLVGFYNSLLYEKKENIKDREGFSIENISTEDEDLFRGISPAQMKYELVNAEERISVQVDLYSSNQAKNAQEMNSYLNAKQGKKWW